MSFNSRSLRKKTFPSVSGVLPWNGWPKGSELSVPRGMQPGTVTEQARMLGVDGSVRSAEENRTKHDNNA